MIYIKDIAAQLVNHYVSYSFILFLLNCYLQYFQIINPDQRRSEDLTALIDSKIIDCRLLPRRAMVLLRLDYCNGLLAGAPKDLLCQLSGCSLGTRQSVRATKSYKIHWIDVPPRVLVKLCFLAYRSIHLQGPHLPSRWIFHSGELNRGAFPTSFDRCLFSIYLRRLWQLVPGHLQPSLQLL